MLRSLDGEQLRPYKRALPILTLVLATAALIVQGENVASKMAIPCIEKRTRDAQSAGNLTDDQIKAITFDCKLRAYKRLIGLQ